MRWLARQAPTEFAERVTLITEKHLDPIEVHNAELTPSISVTRTACSSPRLSSQMKSAAEFVRRVPQQCRQAGMVDGLSGAVVEHEITAELPSDTQVLSVAGD